MGIYSQSVLHLLHLLHLLHHAGLGYSHNPAPHGSKAPGYQAKGATGARGATDVTGATGARGATGLFIVVPDEVASSPGVVATDGRAAVDVLFYLPNVQKFYFLPLNGRLLHGNFSKQRRNACLLGVFF